jgi:hypothetical protein
VALEVALAVVPADAPRDTELDAAAVPVPALLLHPAAPNATTAATVVAIAVTAVVRRFRVAIAATAVVRRS